LDKFLKVSQKPSSFRPPVSLETKGHLRCRRCGGFSQNNGLDCFKLFVRSLGEFVL